MPPPSTFLDHLLVLSLLRAIALFLSRVNRRLSTHSDRLVEVGEEVREKSVEEVTPKPAPAEAANDSEQTTSAEPLIHKTTRRLVTQLAPSTGCRIADLVFFIRVYRRESAAQYLQPTARARPTCRRRAHSWITFWPRSPLRTIALSFIRVYRRESEAQYLQPTD